MILDIIYAIMLLLAIIYGLKKGLVESLFHLIAIIIGIIAAVHLSEKASVYLNEWFNISSKYMPVISFLIIFISVLLLFRLASKFLENVFKVLHINFINKLAGACVWAFAWTMIYSTLLFYGNNMNLFTEKLKTSSIVYAKAEPIAPKIIAGIGTVIPPVKNVFNTMQQWFTDLENN